jgi:hypothetical protein
MAWRFVIHNQASEPYDEGAIRNLIELKLVNAGTLAWRDDLANWTPAGKLPELAALFPAAAAAAPGGVPPIPGATASAPPPATGFPPPPSSGAGVWEERARRFVYWCFRPAAQRPPLESARVHRRKARRTIPVAAAILVALALSFAMFVNSFSRTPAHAGGGAAMAGGGGGNVMENWNIARDAQRYNQNVIDDVHRNNRDSFDRQSETYRRANYDWYNNNGSSSD